MAKLNNQQTITLSVHGTKGVLKEINKIKIGIKGLQAALNNLEVKIK